MTGFDLEWFDPNGLVFSNGFISLMNGKMDEYLFCQYFFDNSSWISYKCSMSLSHELLIFHDVKTLKIKYLICTSLGSNLVLQSFQIGKGLSTKCLKQELTDEQFRKMCFFIQLRDVANLSFFRNLCIYCYPTHIYLYCWKLVFKPNTILLAISFWWKMKQTAVTLWLHSQKDYTKKN